MGTLSKNETLLVLGDAAKVLTMRAKMKAIDLIIMFVLRWKPEGRYTYEIFI